MTQASNIHVLQIPHTLRLSAAERLVQAPGRRQAAKRLVASATGHGIDLNLMWGVSDVPLDGDSNPVGANKPLKIRQVTLAVLGSGRTAMMFLSSPEKAAWLGTHETQIAEISCSLKAALSGLRAHSPEMVTLAQTLIEPEHTWAHQACTDAGMISVGQLDYMRKPITAQDLTGTTPPTTNTADCDWPTGIEVRAIRTLDPNALKSDRPALIEALEGSYQDTLDCPELCGLRSMDDVVESHMATGDFSPSRWHLIFKDGQPAGCCLLTHIPQSDSVELVYLGIAPIARGLGLGKQVLGYAIGQLGQLGDIGIKEVTCAVDNRNGPAIKIYESLGFARFDARIGFVSPITGLA